MLIPILFSVFYLLACFGVATAAENKKVGSQNTFYIAVLLTPMVALVVVAFSSKNQIRELQLSQCKRCGSEYPVKHISCPTCAKEGLTSFVNEPIIREVFLK